MKKLIAVVSLAASAMVAQHYSSGEELMLPDYRKDAAKGGWAFYGFENRAQAGKLFPMSAACYGCHEEHTDTDSTFVKFYPTLIETAKQHGTYKER